MSTAQARRSVVKPVPQSDDRLDSPIARFRENELHRLCRLRHGKTLPADDNGRRAAARMLDALALSGDEGRDRAENFIRLWCPWMRDADRIEAVEKAFTFPRFWSSRDLGDDLKLTWEERAAARITTFRPAGVTDEEMAQRRKAKAAKRMREKRRRATLHPIGQPSRPAVRAMAIASILQVGERCAVSAVCDELKRIKHIRFAHLERVALVTAVHRAIDFGVSRGFFCKEVEPGVRQPVAWVMKLRDEP